ncbi:MAG: hypothetical protein U1E27_11975 [Kiritimatiellia bacterium]|nr:hypothetical protein [Kiritimatiellia bacterium]
MIVRVDFLLDSEKRYQGPVSGRFLMQSIVGTILAILILFSAHLLFKYRLASREVASQTAALEAIRPRVDRVRALQAQTLQFRRAEKELAGWGVIRVEWSDALRQIQAATPKTIQFIQMDVRNDITTTRPSSGGTSAAPPTPRRLFRIRLTGLAEGEQSDETVSQFIQSLRRAGSRGVPLFPSVTLLSIQTERSDSGPVNRFEMEILGQEQTLP